MLKKCVFPIAAAITAALTIAGCSVMSKKDGTFRGVGLTPRYQSTAMVADLVVGERKVMGTAKGSPMYEEALKRDAIASAIQASGQSGTSADVLVGVNFFTETTAKQMTVTVVGYPAYYKNFRPEAKPVNRADAFSVQAVGSATIVGYDESAVSVERVGGSLVITAKDAKGGSGTQTKPVSETVPSYHQPNHVAPTPATIETPTEGQEKE
jgi:hypothetical protein